MNKLKKILCGALALTLCLSITACGDNGDANSDPVNSDAGNSDTVENVYNTVTPGVLTVATSPDYAPYEFYAIDANGNPNLAGFDIALAQYIADYLGLTLEIVPMDFDGVLTELAAHSVDLGIAGLSPDPDRADAMEFSEIYYAGKQAFVCAASTADLFSDLESLNNADVSVAAQVGSIQMDLAQTYSPDADIVSLVKVTDIIAELISGKLDGAYMEYDVAKSYAANYPELTIVCEVPYEDAGGNVVGVAKGNEALLAGVNEAIAACLEDGSFAQFISEAWELAAGETASLVDGEIVPDSELE